MDSFGSAFLFGVLIGLCLVGSSFSGAAVAMIVLKHFGWL